MPGESGYFKEGVKKVFIECQLIVRGDLHDDVLELVVVEVDSSPSFFGVLVEVASGYRVADNGLG